MLIIKFIHDSKRQVPIILQILRQVRELECLVEEHLSQVSNTKSKSVPRLSIKTMSSQEVYKVFPLLKFFSIFFKKKYFDRHLWKWNFRINNECTYM